MVTNPRGIHARPSAAIAQTAARFKADITLRTDTGQADARSVLQVMMLAAAHMDTVTVTADGPDERDAATAIEQAIGSRFD
jgi:phosphocarrier protein HPr